MLELSRQPYKFEPTSDSKADDRSGFQILYDRAPLRAIRVFFFYLGARGIDPVSRQMASWATNGSLYVSVLLDTDSMSEDSVPTDTATNVMQLLGSVDPQFLIKLARSVAALTEPGSILRALQLVPGLNDYSILIPWLRSLESNADSRIKSRSAKLLCQLRPSDGLIQHHLQSRDARIRASVIEALWNPKVKRLDQTVLLQLRSSVADPNHRVVANALVGLYRLGETAALEKMIELCSTKPHLVRAAMAWAMGVVDDSRAVPSLQRLIHDPSFTVRRRANDSLLALGYEAEEDWERGNAPENRAVLVTATHVTAGHVTLLQITLLQVTLLQVTLLQVTLLQIKRNDAPVDVIHREFRQEQCKLLAEPDVSEVSVIDFCARVKRDAD